MPSLTPDPFVAGAEAWQQTPPDAPAATAWREDPTPYEDAWAKRTAYILIGLALGVGLTLVVQALT